MPAKMDTRPEEKSVIVIAAHEDKSGIGKIRMSPVDSKSLKAHSAFVYGCAFARAGYACALISAGRRQKSLGRNKHVK
jgi:hypothetical protein